MPLNKKKTSNSFSIYETRTKLSALLKRVIAGEEITICHGREPIAKIVPHQTKASPRIPGSAKGGFIMSADFDAPLPNELLEGFYK